MVCVTLVVKEHVTGCETDMDCIEGFRCENGVCVPIEISPVPIPWEWLMGIGIGAVIIGGLAYSMLKKKKRVK